ncbi:SIS domain-containing protein [Streptococcus parauberis]|uniref:Sugar isomerase, AgaS family n=1 Tax=Streptococcus parauberis NCFD 2020 TaxID=873447 RepID=F1YXY4_9STRE|nr:SIS domain-containing protein [Streptococcus parauberis]EGE54398.1 sugar isomerase, AgaS family [Streptococcus parauberis NCFD 2020]
MFQLSSDTLKTMGAEITTREIKQEPELWQETFDNYLKEKEEISSFLKKIIESANSKKIKVIFTGAGTSEYVGNTICSYLQTNGDRGNYLFYSIASTDLVASPQNFLYPEDTVLLVSFARSGNSPESVAAVNLVNQFVPNAYHLAITCAKDGQLAVRGKEMPKNHYVFLMPERSNDAGFAMTGSFSCMLFAALLIFDQSLSIDDKKLNLKAMASMAKNVIKREDEIQSYVNLDFNRLVYLGSGSLAGLTKEAQLKILELTAGKIATIFDSSMGFRHGPKSFVNEKTLLFDFVNNHPYTRQYDLDILEEVDADQIALKTIAVAQKGEVNFSGETFELTSDVQLADAYLALPMIVFAQTLALLTSIKVKNLPDTPSSTGTVNRVVKGVIIHDYHK